MSHFQDQVAAVLALHQHKAMNSPYDAKVAVMAVGSAAQMIKELQWNGSQQDKQILLKALARLKDNYHDPAGEFTSGIGEIGSLAQEISALPRPELVITPTVDSSRSYFEIRHGDFGNDEELVTIARLWKTGGGYELTWLQENMDKDVRQEIFTNIYGKLFHSSAPLDIFGKYDDPEWEYLKYHASNTAANLYGNVHWVYVKDKAAPDRQGALEPIERKSIWPKIKKHLFRRNA